MIKIEASYPIVTAESILDELSTFIDNHYSDYRIFVLADSNTEEYCLPLLNWTSNNALLEADILSVPSGESSKTVEIYYNLAETLLELNASRKSLLINIGGGMITDLGGFLASSFKRGIPYINVPTSLLAMVDASAGGKTGINVGDYKNQLGSFCFPEAVFCGIQFLETLPKRELKSGYVESIKHGLIANPKLWKNIKVQNFEVLPEETGIAESIRVKNDIVGRDFLEKGERKKLNFGHTIGHAIESLSHLKGDPLLHGEAIAYGIAIESMLSQTHTGLSKMDLDEIRNLVNGHFGQFNCGTEDIPTILKLMHADKKNSEEGLNFTLLNAIGSCSINHVLTEEEVTMALEWYFSMSTEL